MRAAILILMLGLTGCGNVKRMWSGWTGDPQPYCYQGVTYLQFPSGATAALDVTGKPLGCR